MNLFLTMMGAALLGYAIPVLASLIFNLVTGKLVPQLMARNGRIRPQFVVIHGVVWMLAAVVSGYAIARVMNQFRPVGCLVAASLLVLALWANGDEMKKRQSPLRLVSMSVVTVLGIALGAAIVIANS